MNNWWFVSVLLVAAASIVVADDDHAKDAVEMAKDSFKKEVEAKPHFVMFFAPWCGHCKRLAPTWQDLAKKYNEGDEVVVAKVDCTVETALCSDQDVTGYPTLKFFAKGVDSGVKYRGARDLEAVVKFVEQQMGRAPSDEEELASQPEEAVVENGLYILSEKSFAKHIEKGSHFIKFYAPWCGHCKKLAPTWDELAQTVESSGVGVKVAKFDCTKATPLCQEQGVKGYPTLLFFKNGEKVETYKGARTLKELKDYVTSMAEDGKVKETEGQETEDGHGDKEYVIHGNKDNFEDTIKKGVSFVKFYAPWCGHCKKLAPTWEELAAAYDDNENVKIVKVDCTSDDNKNKDICDKEEVNGFPTLNVYKDGKKVKEFNGKRQLDDLKKFVEETIKPAKEEL